GASGDIPILPTTGAIGTNPDAATLPLDHSAETAQAGYYKLAANGITSELTTTTRSGMGRFTFPPSTASNLLFKLSDSQAGTDSTHFQVISSTEVAGWITSGHFCGAEDSYTVYFDMTFDHPFTSSGTWQNDAVAAGSKQETVNGEHAPKAKTVQPKSSNGERRSTPHVHNDSITPKISPPIADASGAYLTFDTTANATLQAKVGVSYVSTTNAKQNRTKENANWNFAGVQQAAHKAWNAKLGKLQIGGGLTSEQTTFYTALYHALLHPNVFSDSNGEYMGFDNQIHRVDKGHVEYATYSGWDIYRSQAQLEALVAPQEASDSARSMLNEYDQTGQLPKWALNNGESYVMVGDPADAIIADYYAFGARDFDTGHALEAMLNEANQPNNVRPGLSQYLNTGYLPMDADYGCCNFYGPVSTQQEYNVADHAISTFAAALGDSSTASTFAARANSWQNVFNPATGYLQPKYASGQFTPGFTPGSSSGFVEGNSYQYTPMEPQDLKGAVAAAGGNAAWITKLDGLTSKIKNPASSNADLGNEPSIEIPWEYDYVGAPYKTQALVRGIQQQIFTTAPAGIAGNDDLGTMSAWYVFSALGFYPETPGTADLALGSPVFPSAAVHLPSGKTLTITGDGASVGNPYVQHLTLNGSSWSHAYLKPSVVRNGGQLAFTLGSTPNTSWASAAGDAPPSDTTGLLPALGYSDQANLITTPGGSVSLTIGARALNGAAQTVKWTAATSDGGPSVGPSNGTLQVGQASDGKQLVSLTAPPAEGRYLVKFNLVSQTGVNLPQVVVEIDVAKPGELWPYYNNSGVTNDGAANQADFDGDGWAYSAQQLAANGLTPGATKTVDGLTYTWPDVAPGNLNNIEAGGQTIPLPTNAGGARIGILGSGTNCYPGSTGTFTVTYTDGSTQAMQFALSDWTLGGGGTTTPFFGNVIAASTPYRDTTGGGQQAITTYVFGASAALTPGKAVQSITLPASVDQGQLHVFAFSIG
ncbi:MAG TPA: lectin, partial [Jatrophihabitantaceae bacterium]|nr:lectin [Jatrophihabitantaceae bacterium]